jgi:hypothetical protein
MTGSAPSLGLPTRPHKLGSASVRELVGRHRALIELLLATLLYFGCACFFTWPMVTDPSHIWYGRIGDPVGSMAIYRELVDHHVNPFIPGTLHVFSAPEGLPINWTLSLGALPSVLTLYTLTALFGTVAANGLYVFLGFVGTGAVTFAFVRRLVGSAWIALVCGWAYAFYPFAVRNGGVHADYIQGWVLALGVWRMLELQWHPSRRNAVLAGLAVALSMWWTPYFILIGGVGYFGALVASLLTARRDRCLVATLRLQAITGGIVVVFLVFLGALAVRTPGNTLGVRVNNLAQFTTYSSRWLEFVVPDSSSPLFGANTRAYLTSHLHGSNFGEATLYVGVTVLMLALVACGAALRHRLSEAHRRAVLLLVVVTAMAAITSGPPHETILGVSVPFPSDVIMQITTTWRVYSRFVVLVMLALTVLAAIGMHALVRGRPPLIRVAVLLIATVAIPLDLWARIDLRTTTVGVPAVYTALAHQPRGLTAEYPLVPEADSLSADLFYQNVHGMPMINGYDAGSLEESRAASLYSLTGPTVGARLAALGVRYVLLESAPPAFGLPSPGTPRQGFRLLYRGPTGSVYRVTAAPVGPALPTIDTGFFPRETLADGTPFNWLGQSRGTIELAGGCRGCAGILKMTVASFVRPRFVTVSVGGRPLLKHWVLKPTQLQVRVNYCTPEDVTITTNPGPQSIHDTVRSPDTRYVSIQLSDLSYTFSR